MTNIMILKVWRYALRYTLAFSLAASPVLISGCTSSQINTTANVVEAAAAVAALIISARDPLSGSDLASFDPSQALINLSLSNATIYSTSGTGTITVTDASNGATLGQESFGWVVKGNSICAQDPTSVHSWLQQFSGYSSVDVSVNLQPQVQATSAGSASVTESDEYEGTTYASAYAGWTYNGSGSGSPCPPNRPCPIQP